MFRAYACFALGLVAGVLPPRLRPMKRSTPSGIGTALRFRATPLDAPAPPAFLRVKSGRVLRDRIREDLDLRIADRHFRSGVAMRSVGEIEVVLREPAARFEASLGTDSNDIGYYSNGGRGNAIATVEAAGRELYRSPVLHEGLAAIPVAVDLAGCAGVYAAVEVGRQSAAVSPGRVGPGRLGRRADHSRRRHGAAPR